MTIKRNNIIIVMSLALCLQSAFAMDNPAPTKESGPLDVPADVHKYAQGYLSAQDRENARIAMGNSPLRGKLGRPKGTLPVAILSCPTLREINEDLPKQAVLEGSEPITAVYYWTDSKGRRWMVPDRHAFDALKEAPITGLNSIKIYGISDTIECVYISGLRLIRHIPLRANLPNIKTLRCRAADTDLRKIHPPVVSRPQQTTSFGSFRSSEGNFILPDGFKVECDQEMPAPHVVPQAQEGVQGQ